MMAEYQLTSDEHVIRRTHDQAAIPDDDRNLDFQAYQAWLADGGVPDPYVPPPETKPVSYVTQEQFAELERQVAELARR
jgi:hypothetical protein